MNIVFVMALGESATASLSSVKDLILLVLHAIVGAAPITHHVICVLCGTRVIGDFRGPSLNLLKGDT